MPTAWDSLIRINAPLIGVAGILLSLLVVWLDPNVKIEIEQRWLILLFVSPVLVLGTSTLAYWDLVRQTRKNLSKIELELAECKGASFKNPAVLSSIVEPVTERHTLLVEPSGHFGVDAVVTVFHKQLSPGGTFERQIAMGRVVNVQENKLIQVLILVVVNDQSEAWVRLKNNDLAAVKEFIVKPSAPYELLKGMLNG